MNNFLNSTENTFAFLIFVVIDDINLDKYRAETQKNKEATEKLLFHGTVSKNIPSIIRDGFKLMTGMHGHIGKGIYFADSIEQSIYYNLDDYTGNETEFTIIVCKVLLGNCLYSRRYDQSEPQCPILDSNYTFYGKEKRYKEYCCPHVDRILPAYLLDMTTVGTVTTDTKLANTKKAKIPMKRIIKKKPAFKGEIRSCEVPGI